MASTKQDWKGTGKELGHAFKGLGKTIVRTARTGVNKASEWADRDDNRESAANENAAVSDNNNQNQ